MIQMIIQKGISVSGISLEKNQGLQVATTKYY